MYVLVVFCSCHFACTPPPPRPWCPPLALAPTAHLEMKACTNTLGTSSTQSEREMMESIESTHATGYYSLQYNWFQDFFGIYPFGRGISQNLGRYLDIRLCSIPTVGVYEKQGKLHLTRSTSYLLYYSSSAPSPLLNPHHHHPPAAMIALFPPSPPPLLCR